MAIALLIWAYIDSLTCQRSAPLSVLLVENIHTYYSRSIAARLKRFLLHSDLPGTTVVEQLALSGFTLEEHAKEPVTRAKLLERDWYIVVLQENSSLAAKDLSIANTGFIKFNSMIRSPRTWKYLL